MDSVPADVLSELHPIEATILPPVAHLELGQPESPPPKPDPQSSKASIRRSLKASTADGMFATIFSNITTGVLLVNFLLEIGASPKEIGLFSSIPMIANLLQPLGAYLSSRTTSRHWYCLWIYGPARLLWVILLGGIWFVEMGKAEPHTLVTWTIGIAALSHGLGALGSAPWFSWMAVLVPRRLRGRYFGIRNSAANLTNLLSVPLLGLLIAQWGGGSLQGYGVVLALGIVSGFVSLWFQNFIVDVNPQVQRSLPLPPDHAPAHSSHQPAPALLPLLRQDTNFLIFLLYFALWMFAVNLSGPFFNLYLLDNLHLEVSQVTLYNSLTPAANLIMLVFWGRLADRIGNRSILLGVSILVALTPILWLFVGTDALSIWLWIPLLHLLTGGTWAAVDLCGNNLQIGVAAVQYQATYFSIVAAVAGVTGAFGASLGGVLAELWSVNGLLILFALSTVLRFVALIPLVFVHEQRDQSLTQLMQVIAPAPEA